MSITGKVLNVLAHYLILGLCYLFGLVLVFETVVFRHIPMAPLALVWHPVVGPLVTLT